MRDSQRQKVYDAEWYVRGRLQSHESRVENWDEAFTWLMEIHERYQEDTGEEFTLGVKRTQRRAYCEYHTWGADHRAMICLPAKLGKAKRGDYKPVWFDSCARYSLLLHEYAHAVPRTIGEVHGPIWASTFLEMLKVYHPDGPQFHLDLRNHYYWNGVKTVRELNHATPQEVLVG